MGGELMYYFWLGEEAEEFHYYDEMYAEQAWREQQRIEENRYEEEEEYRSIYGC